MIGRAFMWRNVIGQMIVMLPKVGGLPNETDCWCCKPVAPNSPYYRELRSCELWDGHKIPNSVTYHMWSTNIRWPLWWFDCGGRIKVWLPCVYTERNKEGDVDPCRFFLSLLPLIQGAQYQPLSPERTPPVPSPRGTRQARRFIMWNGEGRPGAAPFRIRTSGSRWSQGNSFYKTKQE